MFGGDRAYVLCTCIVKSILHVDLIITTGANIGAIALSLIILIVYIVLKLCIKKK